MRIILVTHYFPPETGAPQARLSALAAAWAADGDAVTVLTGMPNHPTGVIPAEYRGAIRRRERRDGYRGPAHLALCHAERGGGPQDHQPPELHDDQRAARRSRQRAGRRGRRSSPTFFAVGAGWLLARLKRARFVVEVRDLWPAIFTELGVLTSRPVIRLLERLELAAYAAADTVIVVSDGFRSNLIGRGVPAEKVHTIRNGVRPDEFDPGAPADALLRARLGARPDDCLVLYSRDAWHLAGAHLGGGGRRKAYRGTDQGRVRRRRRGQEAAAKPGRRARAEQRHAASRRPARTGSLAARSRRHLPGPAA